MEDETSYKKDINSTDNVPDFIYLFLLNVWLELILSMQKHKNRAMCVKALDNILRK